MATIAAAPRAQGGGITTKELRHVYPGGKVALDGVDLQFGTGLFGLLGPNGAGKSTLMRILCTLLVPTSGRATVGGHDVVAERAAVRGCIGYLPQTFGAWKLHRVGEALDTFARLSGMKDGASRQARVRACLEQVGLSEVIERKVKKLSGGMLRRLGVAQALVHEPPVLIVDEPTVGLDPQERLRFRQLMTNLGQDRTILLSTHIVADLGSGCSDLALIDAGKIQFRGSPVELVEQARERVFEVNLPASHEGQLGPGYEVVSRSRTAAGTKVRAVSSDGRFPDGAQRVDNPTLEEAYLAFMAARGRAEAAVAEEEAS